MAKLSHIRLAPILAPFQETNMYKPNHPTSLLQNWEPRNRRLEDNTYLLDEQVQMTGVVAPPEPRPARDTMLPITRQIVGNEGWEKDGDCKVSWLLCYLTQTMNY